jgi:hypothetical protein
MSAAEPNGMIARSAVFAAAFAASQRVLKFMILHGATSQQMCCTLAGLMQDSGSPVQPQNCFLPSRHAMLSTQ